MLEENLAFSRPFSFLRIWPFFKLLMAEFGLFNFSGPGNPGLKHALRTLGAVGEFHF